MRIATILGAVALATTIITSTARGEYCESREHQLARIDQLAVRLERQAEITCRLLKTHYVHHPSYDRLAAAGREIAERAAHIHADAHDTHGSVRDMRHIRRELSHAENLVHDMRRVVRRMKRDVHYETGHYRYSQPRYGISLGHGFRISLVNYEWPSHGRSYHRRHTSSSERRMLNLLSARLDNMDRLVHELDERTWHLPRL